MSGSGLDGIQTEDCTLCSFTEGLLGSFLPDDHYVLGFSVNFTDSGLVDWPAGCPRLCLI